MIKLIKSSFYKEKKTKQKLIKFIKDSKQLSFGKEYERFEKNFAIVRAHGWDRNLSLKSKRKFLGMHKINPEFYARYTFFDLGFNLRPTEINGSLGNIQLGYLDEVIQKRNQNFLKLAKVIYKNSQRYFPISYEHMDLVSNFAFPLICRTKKLKDTLVQRCRGKIEIRPIVGGSITEQPFFRKYIKSQNSDTPNADFIHQSGLYFGNNPELTKSEIDFFD